MKVVNTINPLYLKMLIVKIAIKVQLTGQLIKIQKLQNLLIILLIQIMILSKEILKINILYHCQ